MFRSKKYLSVFDQLSYSLLVVQVRNQQAFLKRSYQCGIRLFFLRYSTWLSLKVVCLTQSVSVMHVPFCHAKRFVHVAEIMAFPSASSLVSVVVSCILEMV